MDEKSKRKSLRNFNLEKRQERHFDLDKEEPKVVNTVDNSKISNSSNQQTYTKVPGEPTSKSPQNGNSKSWLWIILVVVVAIIAFLCYKGCSNQNEESTPAIEDIQMPNQQDEDLSSTLSQDDTAIATKVVEESEMETPSTNQVLANNSNSDNGSISISQAKQPSQSVPTPKATFGNDLEENARRVIRGDFGNGQARKEALGDRYTEIQNRINEIYKEKGLL